MLEKEDENYVPYNVQGQYGQLFSIIEKRYAFGNIYGMYFIIIIWVLTLILFIFYEIVTQIVTGGFVV